MKNVCETINANDAGETFNIFKSSQTFNKNNDNNIMNRLSVPDSEWHTKYE